MWSTILQGIINFWLIATGKRRSLDEHPWLKGPMSTHSVIGDTFYREYAEKEGLKIAEGRPAGLLSDFNEVLMKADPLRHKLNPRIAKFYEDTSEYQLEVWS